MPERDVNQLSPGRPSEPARPGGRRLLAINQVVGPLMRQLLEDLQARGVQCAALTGWVDAEDAHALAFETLPAMPLRKSPAWKRLWSWGRFTCQAIGAVFRRTEPLLVVTNPPWPMLVMPPLARVLGRRYALLVYDIYPDVAELMGIPLARRGGAVSRAWRWLSRQSMLRADAVITIGRRMAQTLRGHLQPGDDVDITVIPNWADTEFIKPIPKADNDFAAEHGLVDKCVVMYSGAFGATHDTDSILAAASRVTDLPDVQFMLIGGGTRQREVRQAVADAELPNLKLLGLQPFSRLPKSLASADMAIVCLDEGYEGISVPSKTYYMLAAGTAVLAISPPDTELTDLVARFDCGLHVPPRSPDQLASAIRSLRADPSRLARMQANARKAAEEHFSRSAGAAAYEAALQPLWRV